VLGKVTSGGKYGPYLDAASDGRQTAVGIAFNDVTVYAPGTSTLLTAVAVPILIHGFVNAANLPFTSGNAAAGGYLDANGQADLKNVIFVPAVA
jgi:head decoration protein D